MLEYIATFLKALLTIIKTHFSQKKVFKIKPRALRNRHACPFFGFYLEKSTGYRFKDAPDNRCPFQPEENSTCIWIKERGIRSCWCSCQHNHAMSNDTLRQIIAHGVVFPEEFSPGKNKRWDGIPFKDWYHYRGFKEP